MKRKSLLVALVLSSVVFIPSGVQFAINTFRGGFLVTDGHHNRVLYATLDGVVSEMIAFGNIVPTGLEVPCRLRPRSRAVGRP